MLVRNLYLLPALVGSPIARQDMWHGSNRDEPEYLSQISPELLPHLSEDERSWISGNSKPLSSVASKTNMCQRTTRC